jgi:hypothetical protein
LLVLGSYIIVFTQRVQSYKKNGREEKKSWKNFGAIHFFCTFALDKKAKFELYYIITPKTLKKQ